MSQDNLYKKIFQRDADGEGSLEFITEQKNQYPFFAPANYFLLKNTAVTSSGYENIAATTALHFPNPFLLNQLLTAKEPAGNTIAENNNFIETQLSQPENIPEKKDDIITGQQAQIITAETKEQSRENPQPEIVIVEPTKEAAKEELIFEPLYTTDYFASQGIKLSEEVQPADKLGKQLKSFTEWLKTMKKVHENRLPEGNESLDAAVQTLAEKSNKEAEIITEAMAEAYLQQGKISKALETYSKLSLLDPAKSAFFAAKIEQLKEK